MRQIPVKDSGIKRQQISITFPNGKTYLICSKHQMDSMLLMKSVEIHNSFQEQISAGQFNDDTLKAAIAAELNKWQEDCGFATLNWVLERMPPAERERFKMQYRFGGVNRRGGN